MPQQHQVLRLEARQRWKGTYRHRSRIADREGAGRDQPNHVTGVGLFDDLAVRPNRRIRRDSRAARDAAPGVDVPLEPAGDDAHVGDAVAVALVHVRRILNTKRKGLVGWNDFSTVDRLLRLQRHNADEVIEEDWTPGWSGPIRSRPAWVAGEDSVRSNGGGRSRLSSSRSVAAFSAPSCRRASGRRAEVAPAPASRRVIALEQMRMPETRS